MIIKTERGLEELNLKKCDNSSCNNLIPPLKIFKYGNFNLCERCYKSLEKHKFKDWNGLKRDFI